MPFWIDSILTGSPPKYLLFFVRNTDLQSEYCHLVRTAQSREGKLPFCICVLGVIGVYFSEAFLKL